jgi:hypothetical protein
MVNPAADYSVAPSTGAPRFYSERTKLVSEFEEEYKNASYTDGQQSQDHTK